MSKARTRKNVFHTLTIVAIVASVCFSVFRFAPVFGRILEALKDVGTSFLYYFLFVTVEKEYLVTATIGIFPENLEAILPITLEEFEVLMSLWGEMLIEPAYMEAYLQRVGEVIFNISQTLLLLFIPSLMTLLVLILVYQEKDTKHNKDSRFLSFWKKLYSKTLRHAKYYVTKYIRFLKQQKWYKRILFGIWFYNLSGLTIALESFAWLFYFSVSWDFESTLVWLAKVLADFTVPLFFFPPTVWFVICYVLFDKFRIKIGIAGIKGGIDKVVKFLKDHVGAKFLNGKQRSKKTSLMTQLKTLSESCVLRPKAQEGWLNRAKQFPNFPWIIYARFLIEARKNNKLHNWTDIHNFLQFLQFADRTDRKRTESEKKSIRRHLRKRYGYEFDDFCFGYDRKKYSDIFDDGLKLVTIYEALEGFGKQFFLYSQPTPLDVSNYPIRSDFEIVDYGNLPEFKNNLVEMDTRASYKRTQWGHRINWDSFRLGKKFDPKNPENNSVEYMIRCSMEHAKERKNQLTRRASDREEGAPTQDNDFVEMDTKIRTHIATCDNFTYQEDLSDDQRASSLGADNVELMTKIYIRSSKGIKFYIPFFAVDEAVYLLVSAIFDGLYLFLRKVKGSNTALEALLWKLYFPIYRHYTRYKNLFSYYPLELKIEDGSDGEVLSADHKLPLISIIAYRGRFKTDSLSAFYYRKMKGSVMGLNDIEQYTGESMTMKQMQGQNAYMIKDLTKHFGGNWKNPLNDWLKEQEKKKNAA